MKKILKRIGILAGIAAAGYLTYFGVAVAGILFFPYVVGTCLTGVKIGAALAMLAGTYHAVKDTFQDIKAQKQQKTLEATLQERTQEEEEEEKVQQRTQQRFPQNRVRPGRTMKKQRRRVGTHHTGTTYQYGEREAA
ncbi:MAG: hypothetical protein J6Y85_01325 [Alphaproteobacteria bacterium]|nr:hypothetical protein [Alphaproteobacteria bacterium]